MKCTAGVRRKSVWAGESRDARSKRMTHHWHAKLHQNKLRAAGERAEGCQPLLGAPRKVDQVQLLTYSAALR